MKSCMRLAMGLLLLAVMSTNAVAQDAKEQKLIDNPDNAQELNAYFGNKFGKIQQMMARKPDEALKQLDALTEFVGKLKPTDARAKSLVARARSVSTALKSRIESSKVTLNALLTELKDSPDDLKKLNLLRFKISNEIGIFVSRQPEIAAKRLEKVKKGLESISPSDAKATNVKKQLTALVKGFDSQIAAAKMTVEEVVAKVKDDPKNAGLWQAYLSKVSMTVSRNARSKPDMAEAVVKQAQDLMKELNPEMLTRYKATFANYLRSIEGGKRLAKLVGMDAKAIGKVNWVNGSTITDDDLKGKVVLLDFWAVWCGPCIATFPHLREWHEKYHEKGLEIVGVTNYYNYKWNEDAGRASRSQEPVSPEEEHAMLEKFAKHHKLKHRFAVTKDRSLSQYYAVSGIPHVVVIDRAGKVRMIRVGSGQKNANDIGALLEKLIAPESGD